MYLSDLHVTSGFIVPVLEQFGLSNTRVSIMWFHSLLLACVHQNITNCAQYLWHSEQIFATINLLLF